MLIQTPSQTVGPFFSFGLIWEGGNVLVSDQTAGQRILIEGTVYDGDDHPIVDAMVEIWQADANGIHNHPDDPRHAEADPAFRGFGRSDTVDNGRFSFKTVKPGPVPFDDERMQAPHVSVRVFSRGMLVHAITRLYFSDEEANGTDPILNLVDQDRQYTLIATRQESEDLPTYRFDIHLQGDDETAFFTP